MTTQADDLLRRALEWIEYDPQLVEEIHTYLDTKDNPDCKSVQKRLEIQGEAEPVAWAVKMIPRGMYILGLVDDEDAMEELEEYAPENRIPLYLHPPKQTKPMTEEEIIRYNTNAAYQAPNTTGASSEPLLVGVNYRRREG